MILEYNGRVVVCLHPYTEGARPRLSAVSSDKFIQVDGEGFTEMNENEALDAYEDCSLSSDNLSAGQTEIAFIQPDSY